MKREHLNFAKWTKWMACALFFASAILSAGCYLTELNADGSGVITREIFIPPNTDPQSFCRRVSRGRPTRVAGAFCLSVTRFRNLSELRDLLEAVNAPGIRINQLERTPDGRLKVDLSIAPPEWPIEDLGGDYAWKLKLPGQILSHNAHQANGGELTWQVKSDNGVIRVEAESRVQ